jgi:flagellar hook-associated protein 1 FlgK
MSLSNAFRVSSSGVSVNSTQSDIVARNIANAQDENYTKKTANVTTGAGGTAEVSSVSRSVDDALVRIDRDNTSQVAKQSTIADGISSYTDLYGQPEDGTSVSSYMTTLESAIITLESSPSDGAAQASVVSAASNLADNLNAMSGTLDTVSSEVEMSIKYDVADVNDLLYQADSLNDKIASSESGSVELAEYQDQMDKVLDSLAEYMDIQTTTSQNGTVSIYTSGGTELLTSSGVKDVTYNSTSGQLYAGRVEITPNSSNVNGFSQGSLAGLFELKTDTLPTFQAQLDSVAAALIEGFESANPVSEGGQGIFTDNGATYDENSTEGLAGRITVNQDVVDDPSLVQSSADDSTLPGDTSYIQAMKSLFTEPTTVDTAGLGEGLNLSTLASTLVSTQQLESSNATSKLETLQTSAATVSSSRSNAQGVNTDDEATMLTLIENSYSANAKVLTAVAEMLDTIIEAV